MSTYAPFAKPLYVMLKPVGAVCNLACDYCYYLEKSKLYRDNPKHVMSEELLEKFIEEYINSQTMPQVLFTWHGGETLMRPLSFYKRAMELQRKYANGRTIDNCIQTNGTLLTDEWCRFFKENNWLVGVSIDGPQEFHDEYRKNKQGKPSFVKVMQGINLLKKHGVEWNGMAVVNDYNADYPLSRRVLPLLQGSGMPLHPVCPHRGAHCPSWGRTPSCLPGRQGKEHAAGRLFRHAGTMGRLPMRLVRRMGKAGRGYLLHTVIRLYPCQLDRRTTGCMFHGKDVRPCRRHGVQRRRICVRPFCFPRI